MCCRWRLSRYVGLEFQASKRGKVRKGGRERERRNERLLHFEAALKKTLEAFSSYSGESIFPESERGRPEALVKLAPKEALTARVL